MSFGFTCDRGALHDALAPAVAVAGRAEHGRVALSGVLLQLDQDQLTVTGSDLTVTISVSVDVRGSGVGVTLLPARLMLAIVSIMDDAPISMKVDSDMASVVGGASAFKLRAMRHEDYPDSPHGNPEDFESASVCNATALADEFARVSRSASRDETRGVLTGVLLETDGDALCLVSTDTFRLMRCVIAGYSQILGSRKRVVVPARAANEFQKLFGGTEQVSVRMAERCVQVEGIGALMTCRLVQGQFPDYAGMVPEFFPPGATTARTRMMLALKRVGLLALTGPSSVDVGLNRNHITLDVEDEEIGNARDDFPVDYLGTRRQASFNHKYLLDGVDAAPGESITLHIQSAASPCVVRVGDDYLYLLMPQMAD